MTYWYRYMHAEFGSTTCASRCTSGSLSQIAACVGRGRAAKSKRNPTLLAAADKGEAAAADEDAEKESLLAKRESEKYVLFGWLDLRAVVLLALVAQVRARECEL